MNAATTNQTNATHEPTIAPIHTKMSPVDWWSGWSDFFGITAAVIGGLLAIITLLGWGFSWKAGKVKDEALERFKSESNARISEANTRAAEANKAAADANERAATLEKEAATARLELEQIKEKQRPRTITKEQRAKFKTTVTASPKGRVKIGSMPNDNEGFGFAAQLRDMLVESGFEVDTTIGIWQMSGKPVVGLRVSNSQQTPPPYLWSIVDGLKSINIDCLPIVDPFAKDFVMICVGAKPQ